MQVVVVLLLLSPLLVFGQLDPEDEAAIDEFMNELLQCRGMPGAAVSLVKDNQVVLAKGYGVSDLDSGEPVTEDTVFAIASVSKSFTSTLFSKLFEDNQPGLTWDSVVGWASPDDPVYFYDGYVTNHTMFRDLQSHQTSIPRHDAIWTLEGYGSRDEFTQKSRFLRPLYEFRADLLYNNLMYTLAAHPIEGLLGMSFEELLRDNLLVPLGMDSTTFYDEAADNDYEGFATPYGWDVMGGNPDELAPLPMELWRGSYLAGPAASVCSSANDMGKWMQFILQEGIAEDGTDVMSPDALNRLWYPETAYDGSGYASIFGKPNAPVTYSMSNYGLSYFNGHYRGYQIHEHGGDLTGFHSIIFFMPDMNISSFFTTNFGGITLERDFAKQFFADVLLGVEPAYNATTVCQILEDLTSSSVTTERPRNALPRETENILHSLGYTDNVINFLVSQETASFTSGIPKKIAKEMYEITSKYKSGDFVSMDDNWVAGENYTGVYGNFAFGNLTVSLSEKCEECLALAYGALGRYTMYPTENPGVFLAVNDNTIMYYNMPVVFSGVDEETGQVLNVSPLYFEIFLPPVFERGLRMDDAPPFDIDEC